MTQRNESLRQKVREVLEREGPLARRTLAYRLGIAETFISQMIREKSLEVVGRERVKRGIPKRFAHPIVYLPRAA